MKYCCVLVDFWGALPGEFLPTNGSLLVGVLGGRMGPGPGGHGRAAVDEPRVTANWNSTRVSGTALSARGSLG